MQFYRANCIAGFATSSALAKPVALYISPFYQCHPAELKAQHLMRQEPKDYVVKDDDILFIRFSV